MSSNKILNFKLENQKELLNRYEKTIEDMQKSIIKELTNISKELDKGNILTAISLVDTLKSELKEDLIGGEVEL